MSTDIVRRFMINEKPNIAMNVNVTYPNNPDYDMEVKLEKINLDKERVKDLRSNNGFIVTEPKSIKKDLKGICQYEIF